MGVHTGNGEVRCGYPPGSTTQPSRATGVCTQSNKIDIKGLVLSEGHSKKMKYTA